MNCLLYARVSTDKQAQKDLSIPAQIAAMRDYAKRSGWKVIGHFIDKGESAKTANRPELKKLLNYCKENKGVDIVIVHKIDRLARNLIDYATIKAILKQKGIKTLKRTTEDLGNKELKLLDEMLEGKVPRDVYERMEKKYMEKKREAEARLSQLEVDYDDPLDFLDKCILVSSMLLYLHQRFNYEQRKNLLRAIFERIYVRNRAIVDVKLNPPFSFLLREDIENLFKNRPIEGTMVAIV